MALGTNTQNTPIQVRHRTPARSLRTMMIAQITMLKNGIVHARIGHQVCEASVHNQAASPESHNSPPVSRLNSKEPPDDERSHHGPKQVAPSLAGRFFVFARAHIWVWAIG